MPFFGQVNLAPLFSATLCELMASRGITQVRAAELTGIGRNILVRLASGVQWPHADHLAAVAKLATTDEERQRLVDAIASDCAAASGVNRFRVADSGGEVLVRVPAHLQSLVEGALLLGQTNPTGLAALEGVVNSLLPAVVRTQALDFDTAAARTAKRRKNTGAPTARPSLPPKPKAS